MLDPSLASASATSQRIRQSNEIAVLRALRALGPLSRAELARVLRLNRSSSGHIVAGLLAAGLVRERMAVDAPEPARVGRPGISLELVPDAVFFLGIEIGVEHVTIVVIDLEAVVVTHHVEPLDGPALSAGQALEGAVDLALRILGPERRDRCEGVGVSLPAQMEADGFVRVAPLLGWSGVDVPARLREVLRPGLPVLVENDGNAFAIGATYGHAEPRPGVTLFIVLETGVGAGIAIDGTLLRGAHGLAGEIGHLLVLDGRGGMRALETVIGLERLLAAYAVETGAASQPALADFLMRVRDREPAAVTVAEDWSRMLALALVQVCRVIDPAHVVLGGSLAALYPLVSARVIAHLRATQEASFPVPTIVTDVSEGGSAFGAACLLHQRFLSLEGSGPADRAAAAVAVAPGVPSSPPESSGSGRGRPEMTGSGGRGHRRRAKEKGGRRGARPSVSDPADQQE